MSFNNVIFNNSVMFCSALATAKDCTFKGVATLASNQENEYALWIETDAKIQNCKFEELYRGVKICNYYYNGAADAFVVEIDGCSFKNISKKQGVVIDAVGQRSDHSFAFKSVTISNCSYSNVKNGEIYATDNLVPVLSNNTAL